MAEGGLAEIYERLCLDPALPIAVLREEGAGRFVPGRGSIAPKAIIIGEAPGKDEQRLLEPFVGKSGKLLSDMLSYSAIPEAECFITNVVKYRPQDNRKPDPVEVQEFLPYLREEVRWLTDNCDKKPVLVLMGATPISAVCGPLYRVTQCAGKAIQPPNGWTYFPMFHPSYILRRGMNALPEYQEHFDDLRRVIESER